MGKKENIVGCSSPYEIAMDESAFARYRRFFRRSSDLDRMMYLVQFEDGSTTFVFPDEVEIIPTAEGSDGQCGC